MMKPAYRRPIYLTKTKEAIILSTGEMKGAHGLPLTSKTIALTFHAVLDSVGERIGISPAEYNSKIHYAKRIVRQVNVTQKNAFVQIKRSLTGKIKVSGLLREGVK